MSEQPTGAEQPGAQQPGAEQPGADPTGPRGRTARLRAMSRTSKIISAGAAVVLVLTAAVLLASGGPAKTQQPRAKDFTLQQVGQPGQRVSLAAFAGQPVIVNFFASWCTPCQSETPLLARFYRASQGRVIIIGVDANDSAAKARRFLRAAGVRYPVAFDPFPAPITVSYGVYGLPQTFFLNAQHRIVSRVLGALSMKKLTHGVALMDGRPKALAGAGNQDRG
jgi:cytochrome c biogenesis protein CcmG, thiol:disulfide interchange protein DsbE